MNKKLPNISILITTYNEEARLPQTMESILKQDYPKENLEIIIVDDNSTDNTVEIAKKYTKKIYYSGRKFCEISRATAIEKATYDLLFFIDADNILESSNFLRKLVEPFQIEENLVGAYPYRFSYKRSDPGPNRYCSLFGLNSPMQYYSKAREHLTYFEDKWEIAGDAIDKKDYYLVEFDKDNMLTLGAIGFLSRKELLVPEIKNEFFFHSDAFNNLIQDGNNKFAVIKETITHNHCDSTKQFFKKLARNYKNYVIYKDMRDKNWATNNTSILIKNILIMTTFIIPFFDAYKGYRKLKDRAWFYHPFYCFGEILMYVYLTLKTIITPTPHE